MGPNAGQVHQELVRDAGAENSRVAESVATMDWNLDGGSLGREGWALTGSVPPAAGGAAGEDSLL